MPLFRQNSRLSRQYIWFSSCSPRMVNNLEVELEEELGLSGLSFIQEFHYGKIFQILIVG
jgi:hypothetical protein